MRSLWRFGAMSYRDGFSGRRRHWSRGRFRCRGIGQRGVPPWTGVPDSASARAIPVVTRIATESPRAPQPAPRVPVDRGTTTPVRVVARVHAEKCSGCGVCASMCPVGAIALRPTAQVDPARCVGCGLCVNYCPSDAISLG